MPTCPACDEDCAAGDRRCRNCTYPLTEGDSLVQAVLHYYTTHGEPDLTTAFRLGRGSAIPPWPDEERTRQELTRYGTGIIGAALWMARYAVHMYGRQIAQAERGDPAAGTTLLIAGEAVYIALHRLNALVAEALAYEATDAARAVVVRLVRRMLQQDDVLTRAIGLHACQIYGVPDEPLRADVETLFQYETYNRLKLLAAAHVMTLPGIRQSVRKSAV